MSKLVPGSVWRCRSNIGLQPLVYNDDLMIWIMRAAGVDTIIDLRKDDLIQFLDHRMRQVLNERINYKDVEPIVSFLDLKSMKKMTIGIKTTTYWENWWHQTFELVSK